MMTRATAGPGKRQSPTRSGSSMLSASAGRQRICHLRNGTHAQVHFDGTESGNREPYIEGAEVIRGPALTLADNEHLCVHARFLHAAGGIWNLVRQSGNDEARDTAIEEACNCPSGRLAVYDNATGKAIEPDLEKSIVVVEYPPRGEHGPLWVPGRYTGSVSRGHTLRIRNGSPSADAENRGTSRSATGAISGSECRPTGRKRAGQGTGI